MGSGAGKVFELEFGDDEFGWAFEPDSCNLVKSVHAIPVPV